MEGIDREKRSKGSHMMYDSSGATSLDAELIARVLRREEPALVAIYERYSRLIYTIALRITGDHPTAEQVMEDVFHTSWQSAASFQPDGSVVAWLIGIARYSAIDVTRSGGDRSRAVREGRDDVLVASTVGGSGEQTGAFAQSEAVRMAHAELPQAQRQVLELAYYGGLTCVEIAVQLGEQVGVVKSRLRQALMKLRDPQKTESPPATQSARAGCRNAAIRRA